jgi:hypothetical protein
LEKIIDKIKKLHRLSKSQNPHEADLARSKMEEIMYKYDISWDMVEGKTKKSEPQKKENPYKPKRKHRPTKSSWDKSKERPKKEWSDLYQCFYTYESEENIDDIIDDYLRNHGSNYTKR